MRYLLISDLHSNHEAFEAVLQKVKRKRIDRVVCLGDFVGYAADPNKVLDRIRTMPRPIIAVRGNHDKVIACLEPGEMFNQPALTAARWTTEKLSHENMEFLKRLPTGPFVVDDAFVVCHGSPLDEDAYIFSDFDASMNFVHMNRFAPGLDACFFGHSHIPSVFTLEPNGIRVEAIRRSRHRLVLQKGRRYLINPGSVGQPRDRNPKASYALYDSDDRVVTFDRVPYDTAATRRKILKAGLPVMLGDRLLVGM